MAISRERVTRLGNPASVHINQVVMKDGTVRGGKAVEGAILVGHKYPISSVAFSLDSKFIATADKNGHVMLWSTELTDMELQEVMPECSCRRKGYVLSYIDLILEVLVPANKQDFNIIILSKSYNEKDTIIL